MAAADYRVLFEDNPYPIIVFDRVTRELLAVNDAACRHFGCTRAELLGRDVASLRPPEDVAPMVAAYDTSRVQPSPEGPMPFPGAWRHVRKDGSTVHVTVWRIRLEYEGRSAVMALIQDVSQRVEAERALRDSEERYRLLFEAAPLPLYVFDGETKRFLACNEAAVRTYGYSRDELAAMTVFDLRPPEEVPRLKDFLDMLDDAPASAPRPGGDNVTAGVWRHRRRDGTLLDVEITTHVIDFGGRRARLVVANDVTERRRLEEQLRQSQKMEATGLLAGGVAHDFNNILSIVLGATELARRATSMGRPAEPYLAEIEAAAKRASDLTRKLLAFSRRQVLRARPVDLREAVDDFLQLLQRLVGEDVELVVRRAEAPLVVSADVSQLEQVLLNLCTNARQAMPAGGRLVLETRRTRLDTAADARELGAVAGDWAEVRVVDTGVGMDAATRARAFEPFFTTKPEGTGLGLAMVHGIVHQHRGFLHVESLPGSGTTVRVLLPIVDSPAAETTARGPAEDAIARGGRERLLVAEDELPLRRLLATTLEELGYEVLTAADGEEAASAFAQQAGSIALAILDVVMPRLGGVQAYERMRAIDPALKVIFTTGYAPEHAVVSDAVTRHGHALLIKPFTLNELGRVVRRRLDGGA